MTGRYWAVGLGYAGLLALAGCTQESLRVALAAQQRADEVTQVVVDRQHDALRVLLYRDLSNRLEARGATLSDAQREALSDAWNERDLMEFWYVQHERARALRAAGVDAKLAAEQSVVDLLLKQVEARVDRVSEQTAGRAGAQVAAPRR